MDVKVTDLKGYTMIKVSGRVEWEKARNLDLMIEDLIAEKKYFLIFNLDDISFLCSGGIGVLVYNLNRLKRVKGKMYVISSNDYVNYLFETLRFDIIFKNVFFRTYEEFSEKVLDN